MVGASVGHKGMKCHLEHSNAKRATVPYALAEGSENDPPPLRIGRQGITMRSIRINRECPMANSIIFTNRKRQKPISMRLHSGSDWGYPLGHTISASASCFKYRRFATCSGQHPGTDSGCVRLRVHRFRVWAFLGAWIPGMRIGICPYLESAHVQARRTVSSVPMMARTPPSPARSRHPQWPSPPR